MGLLKKPTGKHSPKPTPTPSRLRSLTDGDLYLFVETSLMNTQQRLTEFRQGDFLTRQTLLDLLATEIRFVTLGVEEMQARSV